MYISNKIAMLYVHQTVVFALYVLRFAVLVLCIVPSTARIHQTISLCNLAFVGCMFCMMVSTKFFQESEHNVPNYRHDH